MLVNESLKQVRSIQPTNLSSPAGWPNRKEEEKSLYLWSNFRKKRICTPGPYFLYIGAALVQASPYSALVLNIWSLKVKGFTTMWLSLRKDKLAYGRILEVSCSRPHICAVSLFCRKITIIFVFPPPNNEIMTKSTQNNKNSEALIGDAKCFVSLFIRIAYYRLFAAKLRYSLYFRLFVAKPKTCKFLSFRPVAFAPKYSSSRPKNDDNLSLSVVSRRREKTEMCVFPLFRGDKDEQTKIIVISRQNTLNTVIGKARGHAP